MTDDEKAAAKAAMVVAEKRWRRFFDDHPRRHYIIELASEFPPSFGLPIIRVVERLDDDLIEHHPYSSFGTNGLLSLYPKLMPFTQNRMGEMLAAAWRADEVIGHTDEDIERVMDDTSEPWWFARICEAIEETERVQRKRLLDEGEEYPYDLP